MTFYKKIESNGETHVFYVEGSRLEYLCDRLIELYKRREYLNDEYYKKMLVTYQIEIDQLLDSEVHDDE